MQSGNMIYSPPNGEHDDENDMTELECIATQLTDLCCEYVDISDKLEDIQKNRKVFMARQKELSTHITTLMGCSDIDEVNCGDRHTIIKTDRKSTTSLKINDIETIVKSEKYRDIHDDLKEHICQAIKDTRVTTLKATLKVKKKK